MSKIWREVEKQWQAENQEQAEQIEAGDKKILSLEESNDGLVNRIREVLNDNEDFEAENQRLKEKLDSICGEHFMEDEAAQPQKESES